MGSHDDHDDDIVIIVTPSSCLSFTSFHNRNNTMAFDRNGQLTGYDILWGKSTPRFMVVSILASMVHHIERSRYSHRCDRSHKFCPLTTPPLGTLFLLTTVSVMVPNPISNSRPPLQPASATTQVGAHTLHMEIPTFLPTFIARQKIGPKFGVGMTSDAR